MINATTAKKKKKKKGYDVWEGFSCLTVDCRNVLVSAVRQPWP